MDCLVISVVAFLASGLTLFSGFGLGTLLLPAFSIFFPVPLAVALTAIVHFLNNLFKLAFFGRHADKGIVLRFGLPALAASWLGAQALLWFSKFPSIRSYFFLGREAVITPLNLIIAVLMIAFALAEIIPTWRDFSVEKKHFFLGGILSGFFGGLSGHQGAFRSAFLVKAAVSKECFIGTGVMIACLVDLSRISVYGKNLLVLELQSHAAILLCAVLSAFLGVWIGNILFKKAAYPVLQVFVAFFLILIAVLLGAGLI